MSNLQEIQAWFQKQIHANVELCFDQVRLRKIMVDRWGVCAPVLAIHACCTEGVAAEVSHAFGTPLPIMLKERYVRRLFEKRGLNLQMIHFAVESWALAYDREVEKNDVPLLTPVHVEKKKRLLPIKKPHGEPVKLKGHRKKISDITFSPNGRWLATCSFDRTIRIWDGKKGIQKAVLFGGHRNRIRRLTYRIDGEQLASVGDDGGARLWDMKTGRRMFRLLGHETPATHVCYSPNGRFLVTAAEDATVCIWSVETAERILKLGPYEGGISDICFDKEGMWIAIAHKNRVDLWDLNRNERKASFLAKGDALRILSTQKGNLIIGDDRGLRMIDPGSGAHHLQFRGHYKGITALALDPGGSSLVSAGIDQTVRVWELQDAQLHWTFDMRKTVRRLSVNKAGSIAMGFDESFAILFEMGRGV